MNKDDLVKDHWYVDRRDGELVRFKTLAQDALTMHEVVVYVRQGTTLVRSAKAWLDDHTTPLRYGMGDKREEEFCHCCGWVPRPHTCPGPMF